MKKAIIFIFLLVQLSLVYGQVVSEDFDKEIASLLSYSVPIMTVDDLEEYDEPLLILDAREIEEYNTSHIPSAIHFGYKNPLFHKLDQIDKKQPILLYCSVGYRSEKIGEDLLDMGYLYVYNLYGSIFEWANQGNRVVNSEDEATSKVHTYNKKWSQWIINPEIEKVW